jgi:hypothetical protein
MLMKIKAKTDGLPHHGRHGGRRLRRRSQDVARSWLSMADSAASHSGVIGQLTCAPLTMF